MASPLDQALSGLAGAFAGGTRPAGALPPGSLLGPRYEIVRLLGKGGMGAVYLARDRELGREVALKLIAPHLAAEPGTVERFKREIQLSSVVTHPNVLRVYDLGESDGVRFLTMQFIEGESLADLVRRERPLPLERALSIFRQICGALAAAHERGVLHRDLKPQNVMLDVDGHAYLTDFGLARSNALAAMTQAGALLGTPQYMSPEQVKGAPVDARSDIFSAGIVLYEMLAGELPFPGDTPFEMMIRRTQAPPRPVRELRPDLPSRLERLLDRCLAIDPEARYASVREMLADLDERAAAAPPPASRRPSRRRIAAAVAAVGLLLGVGAVAALQARRQGRQPAVAPKNGVVLIADFDNETGEGIFNGTLEPALGVALEGAPFLTAYDRGSAREAAQQLRLEGTGLGERRARLVAQREGIGVVTSGTVEREGSGYRIGLRAADPSTGQRIAAGEEVVSTREGALGAVGKLAARVRAALGDATPEAIQIEQAQAFGAASLEAAHAYSLAAGLAREGKWEAAAKRFREAIALDPGMARAYGGLGRVEHERGHRGEAERYFREALARADRMSERERHRTKGTYHLLVNRDPDRALEAFRALVALYPADGAGRGDLALAHALQREFAPAVAEARRAVEILPGAAPQRSNLGFLALYSGELASAIDEQRRALELRPTFAKGYVGLALAQLTAGRRDDALQTWEKLGSAGAPSSAAAEGLADLAAHEGRLSDARALLEEAIQGDLDGRDRDAAARKLAMLAQVELASGRSARAAAAAARALEASAQEPVLFEVASVLAERGQAEKARSLADDLERRAGPAPHMYAELVRGAVELRRRNHGEAIARFRSALQRLDSFLPRFALGRAYLEAGAYAEARDELESCRKRRGEAADVFLEAAPTSRFYPPVEYYLGRALEALRSAASADAYRAFLATKRSDEDPMVVDARRRLAALAGAVRPANVP